MGLRGELIRRERVKVELSVGGVIDVFNIGATTQPSDPCDSPGWLEGPAAGAAGIRNVSRLLLFLLKISANPSVF